MNRRIAMLVGILVAAAPFLHAEQTGPIEARVGFTDERTGTRVESVEPTDEDGYRILVSVPADREQAEPTTIEEVVVTGKRLPDSRLDLPRPRHEFIRDYANDRYGFYIYLDKNRNLPFRIYFKDHSAAEIHNR